MEDKKIFLEALQEIKSVKKRDLQQKVEAIYKRLSSRLSDIKIMIEDYRILKNKKYRKETKTLVKRIREAKESMKQDWKNWLRLGREISIIAPLQYHH